MRASGVLSASVLTAALAGPARAQECCYLLVFGSQRPGLNLPKYTHSFATFVRVTGASPGRVEAFTISWLPRRAPIQVWALLPEAGSNYDLHTTLRLVAAQGERVSVWGPFRIEPDLYRRALAQKTRLENGDVLYKAADTGWPARRVSNCVHAISDITGRPLLRIASHGWGEPASYSITWWLSPWIIDPHHTHDGVLASLGLAGWPLCRRDLADGDPGRPSLLRAARALRLRACRRAAAGAPPCCGRNP
jgi:hypothetical protein